MTNALKHAGARRIDVQLRYAGDGVELVVRDDGRGFSPGEAQGPREQHFGILGMQERARKLGAQLDHRQPPDRGDPGAAGLAACNEENRRCLNRESGSWWSTTTR